MAINLPHNYNPRSYQLPLLEAMDSGTKRAVCIWHRRAGKDLTIFNMLIKKAFQRRGTYYHLFPTYKQGRKILWDGITGEGIKFLEHIPPELIARKNDTEMKIELSNGSMFQVVGVDRPDLIVGTNPVGCVFSEYSLQAPSGWDLIRPILRENKGWAAFIYTPRGRNHGYTLYEMAKNTPGWFCQLLTVEETYRDGPGEDKGRVLTTEDIDQERLEGMDEALIQQEYFCSFSGAMQGSYYGKLMERLYEEGHIRRVPYEPTLPVHTAWDIGRADATAIIFWQEVQREIRIIDFLEKTGESLPYFVKELQMKPYVYGNHFAPHDIAVTEFGTGKSRLEVARKLGINFRTMPRLGIEEGVEAVRNTLPLVFFDDLKCERLIRALEHYHKEWDDKRACYKDSPKKDWSSHACDAFRYFSLAAGRGNRRNVIVRANTEFDPLAADYGFRKKKEVIRINTEDDPFFRI